MKTKSFLRILFSGVFFLYALLAWLSFFLAWRGAAAKETNSGFYLVTSILGVIYLICSLGLLKESAWVRPVAILSMLPLFLLAVHFSIFWWIMRSSYFFGSNAVIFFIFLILIPLTVIVYLASRKTARHAPPQPDKNFKAGDLG